MKKLLLFVWASLLCAGAAAQVPGSFLDVNPDVRSAGMGSVVTGLDGDAWSVFGNASAVAFSDSRAEAGVFYIPWARDLTKGTDLDNNYFGASTHFGVGQRGRVLAGFRFFGYGKVKSYDEDGNHTGNLRPRDFTVDAGYAYRISERFGVGATLRLISTKLGDGMHANAFGVDLGVHYRMPLTASGRVQLDAGLTASNLGTKLKYDSGSYNLPSRIALGGGVSARLGEHHLLRGALDAGYKVAGDTGFSFGIGAEYWLYDILALRGGFHTGAKDAGDYNYGTAGLGLKVARRIQADFSWLFADGNCPWRNSWGVALSVMF